MRRYYPLNLSETLNEVAWLLGGNLCWELVFFFSSALCFLRGTSLKRARDDFPLHALVIIWEGEFIRGRKSPGAKKKEPHHGQGRLGAL